VQVLRECLKDKYVNWKQAETGVCVARCDALGMKQELGSAS